MVSPWRAHEVEPTRKRVCWQCGGALHHLEVDRKAEALRKGWAAVPDHVFCTERGGTYDDNRWRKAFQRCAKAAGLAGHFYPHSLRHSFASLLLQDGASVEHVSRLLGHADIGLTCRTYGRWLCPNTKGTMARLDAIAPVGPALSKMTARRRPLGARG
jgi:integrase